VDDGIRLLDLERSKPKEMFCKIPVINVKALAADKVDVLQVFMFVHVIKPNSGTTFVFAAQMKTKAPPGKWVLAAVALILRDCVLFVSFLFTLF
jgi:dynein heavy chain